MSQIFAVFPGQGSQHVGMAKDFFQNYEVARNVFEEASDAVKIDLKKLCFDSTEKELTLTENTQPCLLVASVAAYRVAYQEFRLVPNAVAGHSLGEYSALVAAGSLDLATAAYWVRERGLAMQKAVPAGEGSMAAILGLEDSAVESLCLAATQLAVEKRSTREIEISVPPLLECANFNAPSQVVISGSIDAIEEAIQLVKTDSRWSAGKAIPLQVSAPFHCKLMAPARARMAELFMRANHAQKPKRPICPYVPNRTARLTQEAGTVFEFLVEQVDHSVLWKQSVSTLLEQSYSVAVEFGPGKVLSGLIKRIAGSLSKQCVLTSIGDTASMKSLEAVLTNIQK